MKLYNFIICDDVRREVDNKHTLVGVYGNKLIYKIPKNRNPDFKLKAKLCFFFTFKRQMDEARADMNKNIISSSEYRRLMRQLNKKLKAVRKM